MEQIKRLPELLERPVVLMDSDRDDTMVAVLADVDGDGLPLIAALRPGANAVSGGRCVPGTIVCSVYGKPESYFLHKMQQMPQRVFYQDIEKGRELDARAKLQLFGGNIASPDLDRKIIRLPECIVKLQAGSAPTEAARVQQESRDMASGSHALGAARPAFGTPAMNRPIEATLNNRKPERRNAASSWCGIFRNEEEQEVQRMKQEKDSEIIATICEYENSVAISDGERLTFRDSSGIIHLKGRGESTGTLKSYADRCNEYLRFGDEIDLAVCGAYSPYDALKVCDTPEIFLKTGFEQRPMLYTQKHLFQALTPKSDYNPHRHGFSIAQVKRFPELLASPVALANSPTREDVLLVILLATDAYDTPLIAGIKPDGTGNYGEREVETNMVLSVYSRQNFIRYFALLRDMDAFVFVSGRKIEALEDLSSLPLAENCSGLDIDRILQRPKCLG